MDMDTNLKGRKGIIPRIRHYQKIQAIIKRQLPKLVSTEKIIDYLHNKGHRTIKGRRFSKSTFSAYKFRDIEQLIAEAVEKYGIDPKTINERHHKRPKTAKRNMWDNTLWERLKATRDEKKAFRGVLSRLKSGAIPSNPRSPTLITSIVARLHSYESIDMLGTMQDIRYIIRKERNT